MKKIDTDAINEARLIVKLDLKEKMKRTKTSPQKLARLSGVPSAAIKRTLSGGGAYITVAQYFRLMKAMGIDTLFYYIEV